NRKASIRDKNPVEPPAQPRPSLNFGRKSDCFRINAKRAAKRRRASAPPTRLRPAAGGATYPVHIPCLQSSSPQSEDSASIGNATAQSYIARTLLFNRLAQTGRD